MPAANTAMVDVVSACSGHMRMAHCLSTVVVQTLKSTQAMSEAMRGATRVSFLYA